MTLMRRDRIMPETGREGNLPSWAGASGAYSTAYRLLGMMAAKGHVKRQWRGGVYCSLDMDSFIEALGRGNEEEIKAKILVWRTYYHV